MRSSPVLPTKYVRGVCGRCLKSAAQRCGRCKKIYYCSIDCQRASWEGHKPYCGTNHIHDTNGKIVERLLGYLPLYDLEEEYKNVLLGGNAIERVIVFYYLVDSCGGVKVAITGLAERSKTRTAIQRRNEVWIARMRQMTRRYLKEMDDDHLLLLWREAGLVTMFDYSRTERRVVAIFA